MNRRPLEEWPNFEKSDMPDVDLLFPKITLEKFSRRAALAFILSLGFVAGSCHYANTQQQKRNMREFLKHRKLDSIDFNPVPAPSPHDAPPPISTEPAS